MSNFQLFKQIPPHEFVEDIIKLYGPNGFDVHYYFTLNDIIVNNVIDNLNNRVNDLKKYYLPCKWHYINNITPKKTLTILRQLLRPFKYKLISTEKYKTSTKYLLYNLKAPNNQTSGNNLTVQFD